MSTSPWDSLARQQQPVRPSLQVLHAACAPPTLADSLDELEGSLVAFGVDLNNLVDRLAPVLHPVEDDLMLPIENTVTDLGDTAPAVRRVQDAHRQLHALRDQLFDIASRIAL